ncbi:hypothetical protein BJV77DRAFT_408306 [Russula vinacea]|nr:hypothetical protein BJV77DRAFT_408306 [Russula vinacea]
MGDFKFNAGQIVLETDYWALTKLWHAVDALYLWEFVTTLDYEWSIIRGQRHYRWTIWVYSLTRVATLLAVILNLIGLDATTQINCQAWATFNFTFAYLALSSSSLLVAFRVIAIWGKNKIVVALVVSVWGINVSCLSQGITRIRSGWDSEKRACVVLNIRSNKLTMIVILVTDIILLSTMLVGLLRMRRRCGDTFALGRLLWTQGVIWLLIGTAAELTPVVFVSLYLSDAWSIMFLFPALLTMSIAATRMYRSLTDLISSIDKYEFSTFILLRSHSSSSQRTRIGWPPEKRSHGPEYQNFPHHAHSAQPDGNGRAHTLRPGPLSNTTAEPICSFVDLGGQELGQEYGQLRGLSFDEDLESAREIDRMVRPLPRIPGTY